MLQWKVIVHFEQPEGPGITLEAEELTAIKPPKESKDETELVIKPVGDGPERRVPLLGPGSVKFVEAWPIK
jgi:hypothetical protein